jgi:hypothetical protein
MKEDIYQVDDKLAWSESIGSEDSEGIGWFSVSLFRLFLCSDGI